MQTRHKQIRAPMLRLPARRRDVTHMHPQARRGFHRAAEAAQIDLTTPMKVLDMGGQDVNGTVHDLMPNATIDVLDIKPGRGVTIVADARTWRGNTDYDLVISTELLEHLPAWHQALTTAHHALRPDGVLIITAASTGRGPHGANGEVLPPPGEHYENVAPAELATALHPLFTSYGIEYLPRPADVYAWARRS